MALQRHGSRSFLNFESVVDSTLTRISREVPQPVTMALYHGNESLRETIRLFASASIVFGYHGAGFVNMFFSKPATLGVEIFTHPCGTKYPGFNFRVLVSGVHWRTLFLGEPYKNTRTRDDIPKHSCKPNYVMLNRTDAEVLSLYLLEQLPHRREANPRVRVAGTGFGRKVQPTTES